MAAGWMQQACADASTAQETTHKLELSCLRDAEGLDSRELALLADRLDTEQRRWQWRTSHVDVHQAGVRAQGQALGLRIDLPEHEALRPPGPLAWVRAVGGTLSSDSRGHEALISAGLAPVTLTLARDALAWWLDLHARRAELQFDTDVSGVSLSANASQFNVSDGNRVRDAGLRIDAPRTPGAGNGANLFATAHRRVAYRTSPYYWSPAHAEAAAGPGLQLRWQHAAWRAEAQAQLLWGLNAQTSASRQWTVALRWQPSAMLRLRWTVENQRSRAAIAPYWSHGIRLSLECSCLDRGPLAPDD